MPYKNPLDDKACRLRNRHKKLAYMKRYREENREQELARSAQWRKNNPGKLKDYLKQYAKDHPEKNKAATRRYRDKNRFDPEWRARNAARAMARRKANPEKSRAYNREFSARQYETNVNFRIKCRLRSRLTKKLKSHNIRKTTSALALTGCTADFLRGYLERQFTEGMTWKNIHIDHHIPCAEFDLRDPAQQAQCFHFTNLRPMWAVDNMKKGAKLPC